MLLQVLGSACSDSSLDTALSPSYATWALNPHCSCRLADSAGLILLEWEAPGFQPLPSWKSTVSSDLLYSSLNAVRSLRSWRSFSQCFSHLLCCCTAWWPPLTAALLDCTAFPQCTPPAGKEHIFPSPRKWIVIPPTPGHRAASSLRSSVWVQLWHTKKNSSSQWGPCSVALHLHHHQHTYALCTAELPPSFHANFYIDSYRGLSLAPPGRVLGSSKSGISSK